MKKISVLVLSVLCCLGLLGMTGCMQPAKENKPQFEVSINKVFTTGSYDGTTLLVINLDVKNNSSVSQYGGGFAYYTSATQDGSRLSDGYLSSDNPYALSMNSSIPAESEGEGQLVYELNSLEGTVEIVMTVDNMDYSASVEILNENIDLSQVENLGSETEYEVTINNVTVTDDGEGGDLVILDATFTNNSASATSFGYAIRTELFQNDISLKSGYLPYNHPAYDSDLSSNSYTDIKQGASIDLQLVFELNDATSPVELTCIDSDSFDKAVILSKVIELGGGSSSAKAA